MWNSDSNIYSKMVHHRAEFPGIGNIVSNLMNDTNVNELSADISQKIARIYLNYNNVMEKVSVVLKDWLSLRTGTILALQKLKQESRLIYRAALGFTFISSAASLTRFGSILKNAFHFKIDFSIVVLSMSFLSATLGVIYSHVKLIRITSGLRNELWLLRDFENLYNRGTWINIAVQELFPFGIDFDLLKDSMQQNLSWRHDFCSAIILTNITRDMKILEDQDFLLTVKAFVQSPAAKIWLNWVKSQELLRFVSSRWETCLDKRIESISDVFKYTVILNMFHLFSLTGVNPGATLFIIPALPIKITLDLLDEFYSYKSRNENGYRSLKHDFTKFEEMNFGISALEEEYRNIKKLLSLISDYN